jgi:hypothetical protein
MKMVMAMVAYIEMAFDIRKEGNDTGNRELDDVSAAIATNNESLSPLGLTGITPGQNTNNAGKVNVTMILQYRNAPAQADSVWTCEHSCRFGNRRSGTPQLKAQLEMGLV